MDAFYLLLCNVTILSFIANNCLYYKGYLVRLDHVGAFYAPWGKGRIKESILHYFFERGLVMFKNKIRKALSLALATTMSFAMTLTGVGSNIGVVNAAESPNGLDSATQVNYSTILGRGVD